MPIIKLTENDVLNIRACWCKRQEAMQAMRDTDCYSLKSLAEKFETSKANVEKIVNGYTWKRI